MASKRKAEFIFVGDPDSVIKAARAVDGSLDKTARTADNASRRIVSGNKRSSDSLDKLGKQTSMTATVSSKGYSAMRVGATGVAAGIAGLAIVGKKLVDANIESEKSQARMVAQLHTSGISYNAHEKQIDKVIQKHSQLAGVDDEDLQDAFTSILRSTGSVSTSLKDMGGVTDLARAKQIDAAQAGEILAKVHGGNTKVLKSMGIEFTASTSSVDRLRASTKKATPEQLAASTAADKQINSQRALGLLLHKVSGQAEAYGHTTAGSIDRAGVAFENLEETAGGALAPTIEKVANATANFVNEMQDGTGQGGKFVDTLQGIWHEAKPIVTWIGRATKNVAEFSAEHPGLLKLAAGVLAVGAAVKTLKFVSAATGFTDLLKAGRVASKALKGVLQRGGLAAGEAAAANVAEGMATHVPVSLKAREGKIGGAFTKAGKVAGGAFGVAAAIAIVTEIAKSDTGRAAALKFSNALPGKDESAARSKWFDDWSDSGMSPQEYLKKHPLPKAAGGMVPGTGDRDTVPILATPGEHVTRKKIVEKFGPTVFADINEGRLDPRRGYGAQRFTSGGIVARANKMDGMGLPYLWGGGHGVKAGQIDPRGEDCSGAVSYALGVSPRVSGAFTSFGSPGPGNPKDTKVYANAGHVFGVFDGRGWGTSAENPGGGPGWLSYNHRPGFTIRHLNDGKGSSSGSSGGDPQETSESGGTTRTEREEKAGSRLVNKIAAAGAKGRGSAIRVAAALGGAVESADTAYGQKQRLFDQVIGGKAGAFGDEDLGTAAGRTARSSEITVLRTLKRQQLAREKKRAAALKTAISRYEKLLRDLGKARKSARGAKRAKISERMKGYDDRLVDLKAEASSLGEAIQDTALDIGDLTRDLQDVASTPDTEGPSGSDQLASALNRVDLEERAGVLTPEAAKAKREATLQGALTGAFGQLSPEEWLQAMGDLRESQNQAAAAVADNTQAIKDLKDSIDQQNAIASSTIGIQLREATRALGDLVSGELGQRVNAKSMMPGNGQLSRL